MPTLMRQSILIIVITFNLNLLYAETKIPTRRITLKNQIKKINLKELKEVLRDFIKSSRPSRMVGTEGNKNAALYIQQYLKKESKGSLVEQVFTPQLDTAVAMYENDFSKEVAAKFKPSHPIYKKWRKFTDQMVGHLSSLKGLKGKNLIWTKEGSDPSAGTIIIGAHYDTMANDQNTKKLTPDVRQPGADDNASGVVVALLLAKFFSQLDFPATIKIVFFDWEELGFLGSEHFARESMRSIKGFQGYLNLEMLGYDSKLSDKDKKLGNMKLYVRRPSEPGADKDMVLAKELTSIGEEMVPGISFSIDANSFNASDHLYFWKNNYTALTFTQNWEGDFNPNYHTSADIPETLNTKTLYKVYRYLASSVAAKLLNLKR